MLRGGGRRERSHSDWDRSAVPSVKAPYVIFWKFTVAPYWAQAPCLRTTGVNGCKTDLNVFIIEIMIIYHLVLAMYFFVQKCLLSPKIIINGINSHL